MTTEQPVRTGFDIFVMNTVLAFMWAFVTGHFSALNLLIGFVLAFVALYIPRKMWGEVRYFTRFRTIARLLVVFVYELVKSAISVTKLVFQPKMEFRSGILAVPLETNSEFGIMLFANLISLTPGTLSLDVSNDRKTLYVHAMDCPDPQAEKQSMKDSFEDNIREALS